MLSPSQDVFRIGAGADCDIVLDSEYVSSLHCLVMRNDSVLVIEDQGSKNGTLRRRRNEVLVNLASRSCSAS